MFVDSYSVPFSTISIAEPDSSYYLAYSKKGKGALKNFVDKSRVVRVLSDTTAIVTQVRAGDSVLLTSVFKTNNLWKLSEMLLQEIPEKSGIKKYTLKLRYKMSALDLQKKLQQIKVCDVRNKSVLIECSYHDLLQYVLPLPYVVYVGLEEHTPRTESRVLDNNLSSNNITFIHHQYPTLKGQEITVSIKEDAYDKEDIDLAGRHVASPRTSSLVDSHATEMATLVAGAGNSFVTGKGAAPEALITSSNFDVLGPDEDYTSPPVSVQNHSYGTVIENFYGVLAEDFDESAYNNSNVLHVFSSGNDGMSSSSSGTYAGIPGYANLTGNFKMAKNVLVVGSVDTVGRAIEFSSKGPAYDGRIKPELVSYSVAGTSNSAAIVSGTVSLLQQAYKEMKGELPPSALIKALLINGATDVGRSGVDFETGFGNLDAYASMRTLKEGKYRSGTIASSETQNFIISVPAETKNLKVTLVWHDLPANANDAKALVYDLDMRIETPSAEMVLPWVLNHQPQSLQQIAERGEDHLNNIEQIAITELQGGDYTISIDGHSVQGTQDYYIAYQWDVPESFQWFYPTASDNFPYNGEAGTYFLWKSTLSEGVGRLEISTTVNGNAWEVLSESVSLEKGYFRYTPPVIHTIAQARMVIGNQTFYTENFTISRPIQTKVGFNCQDSVLISWSRMENTTYHVKQYVNQRLQNSAVTTDTSIVLSKSELLSSLFAVHPEFENGKKAIQGYTFDYALQGVSCYISSFTALADEAGILLTLETGTVYGIDEIILERQSALGFVPFYATEIATTENSFRDTSPIEGLNTYRARLRFVNGEELLTEEVSEYYLNKMLYMVYPNPVRAGSELHLIAKQFNNPGQLFTLYNSTGSKMLSQTLISDRESIFVPALYPGVYHYTIETEDGFYKGKLVIMQ